MLSNVFKMNYNYYSPFCRAADGLIILSIIIPIKTRHLGLLCFAGLTHLREKTAGKVYIFEGWARNARNAKRLSKLWNFREKGTI